MVNEPGKTMVEANRCERCGYVWPARAERPALCPRCRSLRWDKATPHQGRESKRKGVRDGMG